MGSGMCVRDRPRPLPFAGSTMMAPAVEADAPALVRVSSPFAGSTMMAPAVEADAPALVRVSSPFGGSTLMAPALEADAPTLCLFYISDACGSLMHISPVCCTLVTQQTTHPSQL